MNCPICQGVAHETSRRGPPYWFECTQCGHPFASGAHTGIVYIIQQDDTWAVKIGFTSDAARLEDRVRALQTASPFQLRIIYSFSGTVEAERSLHERFASHRLMGEWFRPSMAMAEWLALQKAGAERLRELEGRRAA